MKHFLLFYEYGPDYLERRGELRPEHLALARASVERGELVLGGALTELADTGVLFFKAADASVVGAFAESDPYVLRGLVRSWKVREWMTVVGETAIAPVR